MSTVVLGINTVVFVLIVLVRLAPLVVLAVVLESFFVVITVVLLSIMVLVLESFFVVITVVLLSIMVLVLAPLVHWHW